MPDTPRAVVAMEDFPGLMLDADPRDLPPGAAAEQVNVTSEDIGRLMSRKGFLVVTFEE